MAIHLHPVAELAPRVLLPGDPARAMEMAIELLADDRLMFNHSRGLWGYTGTAPDGAPLTIQATGIGGPSAAIVLEELIELGARTAVRAGTAGALTGDLRPGELLAADMLIADDGVSAALGGGAAPTPRLVQLLAADADRVGALASGDLFYDPGFDPRAARWRDAGALAVDTQSAALAAVAARHGAEFASIVLLTGPAGSPSRLASASLKAGVAQLARAAFAAVSASHGPI